MARVLRFVLGDQLTRPVSSLRDIDPETDVVAMAEVYDEATYVRHHKKKIAFIFSCMRHFADELRARDEEMSVEKRVQRYAEKPGAEKPEADAPGAA